MTPCDLRKGTEFYSLVNTSFKNIQFCTKLCITDCVKAVDILHPLIPVALSRIH